jgi:regulator of RNase E activity RraA
VFARYLTPIEAYQRWTYYDWQLTVGLRGALSSVVIVSPGDFMVGDIDGVVVVPREHVVSVLEKAEEVVAHEEIVRAEFESGTDLVETYRRHALL